MAKLKIIFRKEVWADLNEYYPSFSPGLRKQIDNAIYKLMGGQESKQPKARHTIPTTGASDAVILKRTPKQCLRPNSKTAALLSHYKISGEYMKDDVIKEAANNHGMDKSNIVHNLLKQGYFEIVK